jgi:UDP-N-acetylglucosamine 1-carboxyvinyltransferase
MAATLAKGKSILKNCAIEPEVIDLIKFLNNCGAQIKINKRTISINGVETSIFIIMRLFQIE